MVLMEPMVARLKKAQTVMALHKIPILYNWQGGN
jgi:hypothetical protein